MSEADPLAGAPETPEPQRRQSTSAPDELDVGRAVDALPGETHDAAIPFDRVRQPARSDDPLARLFSHEEPPEATNRAAGEKSPAPKESVQGDQSGTAQTDASASVSPGEGTARERQTGSSSLRVNPPSVLPPIVQSPPEPPATQTSVAQTSEAQTNRSQSTAVEKIPAAPPAESPSAFGASGSASAGTSGGEVLRESSASRQVISLATTGASAQIVQIPVQTSPGHDAANSDSPMIRCRQCGKSASSQLSLCPHCGRELRAAPSRWLTIGLPVLLGVLLLALLALQGGSGPLGIVGAPVRALGNWVSELSASLDPQITVIPSTDNMGAVALSESVGLPDAAASGLPAEEAGAVFAEVSDVSLLGGDGEATFDPALLDAAVLAETPTAPTPAVANPLVPELSSSGATPTEVSPANEIAPEQNAAILPTESPVPTETPTTAPTETPLPTPTPLPTDTPAPTNTPLPATYTVVSGDTALAIALRLGVELDALIAYNNMTSQQAAMLQPGQILRIPGGVVTADTTAGESTYLVRQGDTLVVIAQRNNTTVAELMTANGLSQSDAFTLRPGQTLIIPGPTPAPPATATLAPTATPVVAATATRPAASATTSTVAGTTAGLRVTAPKLRAPISGVSLRCSVEGRLQWSASPDILPDDNYRVHLGFVSGRDTAGNLQITWLVEQSVPSTQTQVALDSTLCGTAPDGFGGQWRWYVDVVTDSGGAKIPVSTPSEIWGFAWE